MSDDIPPPTVHLLVKELKEVVDWYMFGVALAIPVSQLNAIQSSNPQHGVERWLVNMLDYWLKSNTDASWKKIVQALQDTEQHALAARVKQKYLSPPAPASTVVEEDVAAEIQADPNVLDNAAIFKDAEVERDVTITGRIAFPDCQQEDVLIDSQESAKEKTSLKLVYTDFCHQLIDAVSDPLTCQSLTAQLHSTTLISQEKIAELNSGQHAGNSFLKVLGIEEDPHLLTVLIEKMANVGQLQTLWKSISTQLSTMKQEAADVEYESKVAQEKLEARIAQLTNEKEELHTKWKHHEEELKTANKLLKMGEKALPGMLSQGSTARRDDDAQKRISQLEEELTRLRLQRDSCTDAAVQTTNEENEKELCQCSTKTQGWSLRCSNLAKEKMEMEKQYRMMLQQKDREIQQYTQLLEEKGHELNKKQQALDLMQHRPTPKPRKSISSDMQTVSELQQQLAKERKLRETSEKHNRELETELEKASMDASAAMFSKSNEEIAQLTGEISELKAENERLQSEVFSIRSKDQNAERRIAMLEEERKKAESEAQSRNEDGTKQLLRENDELKKMIDQQKHNIEQYWRDIEQQKREIEDWRKESEQVKEDHERQLQKLNDTIEMLNNEKYELEENLKMKEHKLQTITTDFQNQHSGEREDFEALLDECERQKERMESEIEQLNAKLCEVRVQVQTYTDMNVSKDEQIHILKVQLSTAEDNLRRSKSNHLSVVDEYQSGAKRAHAELQSVQQEKQQLQSRFSQAQQEMAHVQQELRKAEDSVKEKQKHCQDHIDELKVWRAQYEEARNDFDVERRQREKDAQAVIIYKDRNSRLEFEIQQLRQKNNIQEQRIVDLEAMLAEKRISVPVSPGYYTQDSAAGIPPGYCVRKVTEYEATPQRGVGAKAMKGQGTSRHEVKNIAKPAMDCPICGRQDFTTQSELEVHCAQCT